MSINPILLERSSGSAPFALPPLTMLSLAQAGLLPFSALSLHLECLFKAARHAAQGRGPWLSPALAVQRLLNHGKAGPENMQIHYTFILANLCAAG
jgi:hypothetical protein